MNLQPTIDLTMGVSGRDLGHVADDVAKAIDAFGQRVDSATWLPYDPTSETKQTLTGSKIDLSGEYTRMQETFRNLGIGLILATLLMYFLMVSLFKSYVIPIVVLGAVPIGIAGVVIVLYITGTAINVQSLLGVIFMVGIVVSNTILLIDFAAKTACRRAPLADRSGEAGRRRARSPGGHDGVRRLFLLAAHGLGTGPRERGEYASGQSGRRWTCWRVS